MRHQNRLFLTQIDHSGDRASGKSGHVRRAEVPSTDMRLLRDGFARRRGSKILGTACCSHGLVVAVLQLTTAKRGTWCCNLGRWLRIPRALTSFLSAAAESASCAPRPSVLARLCRQLRGSASVVAHSGQVRQKRRTCGNAIIVQICSSAARAGLLVRTHDLRQPKQLHVGSGSGSDSGRHSVVGKARSSRW